jgi:hypothetical protein
MSKSKDIKKYVSKQLTRLGLMRAQLRVGMINFILRSGLMFLMIQMDTNTGLSKRATLILLLFIWLARGDRVTGGINE